MALLGFLYHTICFTLGTLFFVLYIKPYGYFFYFLDSDLNDPLVLAAVGVPKKVFSISGNPSSKTL